MPYIYADVDSLIQTPALSSVGTGQCVALVDRYARTPAPAATTWHKGSDVRGDMLLSKGTAIATFVNGKYPSQASGNHAALYYSQDVSGIWVVDQYLTSGGIKKRHLKFKGKKGGKYLDPSNNGDAFSVIK